MKNKIRQTFTGITIKDESLAEKAASVIRKKIIQGILEPGQRLAENELATALEISRACVREALQNLENEGLVNKQANKYTEVVRLTIKDIEEIYQLRAAIESSCVETAMANNFLPIDELEKEALSISKQHQNKKNQKDKNSWIDEDFTFHEMIVLSSQNSRAIQAWMRLKSQAILVLYSAAQNNLAFEIVGDHMALVKTFKSEEKSVAQRKIKAHIMAGLEYLKNIIKPANE